MADKMTDLDMMYDYEKDATAAATGYLTMAAQVHNAEVGKRFRQLSEASLMVQQSARSLIKSLGGKASY